jgi:hypothetical protein
MVVAENLNFIGLVKWANDTFEKKENGKKFTNSDLQQYARIGRFPQYLGHYSIQRIEEIKVVKLYRIIKED